MASRILYSTLAVAVAVLAASLFIITGTLYSYFGQMQEAQLKYDLRLTADATERLGEHYLQGLHSVRYRLTWVDADGTVLFDSHADPATMENHANREEIKAARFYGSGSSVRRSATRTEETMYEATRLKDGSVLRISVSRSTAFMLLVDMLRPVAAVLLFAALLSALLSRCMAKRIVAPLNRLNLDAPLENDAYEELSPLLHRIHAQQLDLQKQMQALRDKEEEFDQITGHMKEALVLLDPTDRILHLNPAATALFDTDLRAVGSDFLTVDRKADMRHALEDAKQRGHAAFRAAKRGQTHQYDVSRIASDGTVHGTVILAVDITEQVRAEAHRREFTANVSHELKTPLQSIIGSAELLQNDIVKAEDVPRFVGHIQKEASRLVHLIDDIIRLSQLDEGAEMPREEVSLRELSEEVCEVLSDAATRKDVSMEVTGDAGILHGVRRLLYEIVYNLCDNAVQYNRPGGHVRISIRETADEVCLRVEDSGIGIAPEDQAKVFERFYRVDKSHSKASGGTGLGLSIVKRAVQYHGGRMQLDSSPEQGTTVSIAFDR